jgi:hypothetical protein
MSGKSPFPLEMFARYISTKHAEEYIGREFEMITVDGVETFFHLHPDMRGKIKFRKLEPRKVVMERVEEKAEERKEK